MSCPCFSGPYCSTQKSQFSKPSNLNEEELSYFISWGVGKEQLYQQSLQDLTSVTDNFGEQRFPSSPDEPER